MPLDMQRLKAAKITDGVFATVIRGFINSPKFQAYASSTRDVWGRELRLAEHPKTLGGLSIYEIRPALVQAYLDGLAETPGKQVAAHAVLQQLEKWAIVRDLLPHSITSGTEVIGSHDGHTPWNDEQIALAEANARQDIARIITLGANTGQRGSDIVKMTWTDLELYDGVMGINVKQQKTGRELWIPLTEPLQKALGAWPRALGPIIGRHTNRKALSNLWTRERNLNPALKPLKLAGLVLHGLRASACVRLMRAGATTRQIADMVGMSEPIVGRYCRLSVQRENAIAAVLHLDRTARDRLTSQNRKNMPGK